MYLHVFSFNSSSFKFFAGSKFLSNNSDLNLLFLDFFDVVSCVTEIFPVVTADLVLILLKD